jgi:hypothetical protein
MTNEKEKNILIGGLEDYLACGILGRAGYRVHDAVDGRDVKDILNGEDMIHGTSQYGMGHCYLSVNMLESIHKFHDERTGASIVSAYKSLEKDIQKGETEFYAVYNSNDEDAMKLAEKVVSMGIPEENIIDYWELPGKFLELIKKVK